MMAPAWGGKGGEEREGGRGSRNVFCKEMFDDKENLVYFSVLAWEGGRESCDFCGKKKGLYDMYGYERVFLICWKKKRKRKTKMKKKNRPTHETERSLSLIIKKNTLIHLSLSCYKTKISIMIIINSTFSPLPNNTNNNNHP